MWSSAGGAVLGGLPIHGLVRRSESLEVCVISASGFSPSSLFWSAKVEANWTASSHWLPSADPVPATRPPHPEDLMSPETMSWNNKPSPLRALTPGLLSQFEENS